MAFYYMAYATVRSWLRTITHNVCSQCIKEEWSEGKCLLAYIKEQEFCYSESIGSLSLSSTSSFLNYNHLLNIPGARRSYWGQARFSSVHLCNLLGVFFILSFEDENDKFHILAFCHVTPFTKDCESQRWWRILGNSVLWSAQGRWTYGLTAE